MTLLQLNLKTTDKCKQLNKAIASNVLSIDCTGMWGYCRMNVSVSIPLAFFTQWIYLNNQTYLEVADNFSVELRLKLKYGSGSFLWGINGVKLPEKTCAPTFHLADPLDYSSRTSPL